ncbi:MAG: hypothetical protein GWN56_01595 [Nitrosopumilaceae archaeon]|nr:hypothetical protein [Nitrosopumilaceae archaeon]
MEENGELEHDMRDMQKLAPRVVKDIEEECETLIKDQLYKMFKKEIMSHAVKGLPEYYKEKLIQNE